MYTFVSPMPATRPVQTLKPADFVVREDDVAREIIRVSPAPPPTHLALLVDNTNDSLSSCSSSSEPAVTSVARQMNKLAEPPAMSLTTFAERPTRLVDFTTSDIAIENGVKKIFQRPGAGCVPSRRGRGDDRSADAREGPAAGHRRLRHGLESRVQRPHLSQRRRGARPRQGIALDDPAAAPTGAFVEPGDESATPSSAMSPRWSGGMNKPVLSPQGVPGAFSDVATAILNRLDVTYGRPDVADSAETTERRDA